MPLNHDLRRAKAAYDLRERLARDQRDSPLPGHPTNLDEEHYAKKIANYFKDFRTTPSGKWTWTLISNLQMH